MTVRPKIDGQWVGWSGGEAFLHVSDEYPDDHPLVQERPELFTQPARQARSDRKAARKAAGE